MSGAELLGLTDIIGVGSREERQGKGGPSTIQGWVPLRGDRRINIVGMGRKPRMAGALQV
jgi:acylphosphatase